MGISPWGITVELIDCLLHPSLPEVSVVGSVPVLERLDVVIPRQTHLPKHIMVTNIRRRAG